MFSRASRISRFITAFLLAGMFFLPAASFAGDDTAFTTQSSRAGGLLGGVTQACYDNGQCTLCDVLVVFINVANGILRLLAILATVFFVYGAAMMMLSQGNEDMVSKGKSAMKATVVGTIIVLIAWQLMSVVTHVLANQQLTGAGGQKATFNPITSWYDVASRCGAVNELKGRR